MADGAIWHGEQDVSLQDQYTQPLQLFFQRRPYPLGTPLTAQAAIGTKTIEVADGSIFDVGNLVTLLSTSNRFSISKVLSIATNTLTIDSPLDFTFEINDEAIPGDPEMNKDGSTTPLRYQVRGDVGSFEIPIDIDITRLIGYMVTADVPDFGKFGDIVDGLTNGLVLQRNNGDIINIHNVKLNGEIKNLCYDFETLLAANPGIGVNGLTWRMSFAGQEKHGVVIRLKPNESLDYLIQDDLSSLVTFRVVAEGHVVE